MLVHEILLLHPSTAFTNSNIPRVTGYHRRKSGALPLHGHSTSDQQQITTIDRKIQLVGEFVSKVQTAIEDQTFASLTLRGTKKTKSKNLEEVTALRGSIRQVQGRLIQVKKNEQILLQLTLKYYGATDICKNIALPDIGNSLPQLILDPMASEWGVDAVQAKPIQGAELKTLDNVFELQQLQSNKPKLKKRKANSTNAAHADASPATHDREKNLPLCRKADFLQALGLTKSDGKPKPGMKSKLSQCQKFVEIVGGLVNKIQQVDNAKPISVVDMGCGRGYLTFALHSYLAEHYPSVESKGVDVRPKLVKEISTIAESLGGKFDTLLFEEGTIETFVEENGEASPLTNHEALRILIALHACDTATDDALWSGICSGADLVVVAPCCHKQVRPQLDAHAATEGQMHPLSDVLKHGVYRERMSETATDSLRALLLEAAGYRVQVFEFIGGEHTSKNVMIAALKDKTRGEKNSTDVLGRIKSLANLHGIHKQKLAEWMNIDLGGQVKTKPSRMVNQMPPLR
eukprot:scaffold12324_cov144-Cylindrotheca_fusiformis.AAC.4